MDIKKRKAIGILGGTFDPPHWGHLRLAEHFSRVLQLDHIIWMPAGQPWQKSSDITPAKHRLAMSEYAIETLHDLFVDHHIYTKIEISTFFRAIEKRDFLHGVIKRIDKKSENDAQYAKRMYKIFSSVAEIIKEHNPKSFIALPRASHQRPIQQPKPVQQRTPSSSYLTQTSVSSSVITRGRRRSLS